MTRNDSDKPGRAVQIRERRKLLDQLIGYGRMLERFSSEDRTMRDRVVTANAQLKDFGRRMRYEKDMKRHLQLEKMDAAAYRKKIAAQISQLRSRIRVTQRLVERS
jgi:hypothetical protein